MENRVSLPQFGMGKTKAPWMAFYLASSLGLVLGAMSLCLAEPTTPEASTNDNQSIESGRAEAGNASASEPGQINIPGIQSAVLTVGKEIQTNVQMINLDSAQGNRKKGNTGGTSAKPKYYLELPSPQKIQGVQNNQDAIPATAGSIPIAPVSTEMAPTGNEAGNLPTPASLTESGQLNAPDPETQPLDLTGNEQAATGTATNMMIRVTLGLMVVLGMLLVFSKKVMPRLLARHPEFFENLKQKQSEPAPLDIPQTIAEKLAEKKAPKKRSLFSVANNQPAKTSVPQQPNTLDLNGKQFSVLSSTAIGKDKDLLLVEIMGRQLVVATTPYTVSLIQDLTGLEAGTEKSSSPTAHTNGVAETLAAEESPTTQLNLLQNPAALPMVTAAPAEENPPLQAVLETFQTLLPEAALPVETEAEPEIEDNWVEAEPSYTEEPSYMEALDTLIPPTERFIIAADLDDLPPETQEPEAIQDARILDARILDDRIQAELTQAEIEPAEFIRPKTNAYASIPTMTELQPLEIADALFETAPPASELPGEAILVASLADESGTLEEVAIQEIEATPVSDPAFDPTQPDEPIDLKDLDTQNSGEPQNKSLQETYAELENSIVLSDYDDVYGY